MKFKYTIICLFIIVCVVVPANIVLADQASGSLKNLTDILPLNSKIRSYCAPCGDQSYIEFTLSEKIISAANSMEDTSTTERSSENFNSAIWKFSFDPTPLIDLAYTYIYFDGNWVNLALLQGLRVFDVPYFLPRNINGKTLVVDEDGKLIVNVKNRGNEGGNIQSKSKRNIRKIGKQIRYKEAIMYYFGQGRKQNIEKATYLLERSGLQFSDRDRDHLVSWYVNALIMNVQDNKKPTSSTVLEICEEKCNSDKGKGCSLSTLEFIDNLKVEKPIIKISPDKKSKAMFYRSNIIEGIGDWFYDRTPILQIETPSGLAQFIQLDDYCFDGDCILNKFDFLSDDALVVMGLHSGEPITYIINLNTFEIKYAFSGHYTLESHKGKKVLRQLDFSN